MEGMVIMKKNILLLGTSGFIGRNLKEFLNKQKDTYEIYAPTSNEFDISDEEKVKENLTKHYYDVIIHAAVYNPRADYKKDVSKELDKNLRMFFNFEKYQNLYGKMIYFGSGAEFDKCSNIKMVNEDDLGNGIPNTDYGFYKYIINKSIQNSENIYNLRIFGLFGKYEDWAKTFISGACCKALKNLPITIRENVYFDYLYIEDFCKIVEWFIDHDIKNKNYNISSGKTIDLLTIANIVKNISGKDIPIYMCKEGVGKEYSANNKRMLKEMENFYFTPIEVAINELYVWYKKQEKDIDIYPLIYQGI
jgi:GDP-L-fucose synthase